MELSPHELMFVFDAVAYYAARPVFDDLPEAEAFFLSIGEKCEKELADLGFTFTGDAEVPLNQR
jgi:hypothetical protein